jgi:hypothetical protein
MGPMIPSGRASAVDGALREASAMPSERGREFQTVRGFRSSQLYHMASRKTPRVLGANIMKRQQRDLLSRTLRALSLHGYA